MFDWTQEQADELVSMDLDLPPIKRWQMEAILWPELAGFLARKYGSKEEQKQLKKLLKKEPK